MSQPADQDPLPEDWGSVDQAGRLRVDEPGVYRILVQDRLREQWAGWFEGLQISVGRNGAGHAVTMLRGALADQAALHGVLARIRDLGLTLLLVELESPGEDQPNDFQDPA